MASQINTAAVEQLDKLLTSFSANFIDTNNSEIIERTIFVTNFMKSLYAFDLTNEDNVDALNTFIESIVSYKFPISILYSICGTSDAVDLTNIIYTVNSAVTNATNKYGTTLLTNEIFENIYITLVKNDAIADIVNNCTYDEILNNKCFIKPVIKTSYIASDGYFNTIQQAYNNFYKNTAVRDAVNEDLSDKLTNTELIKLYEYLKATFNSAYDFPLFAYSLYKNMQYHDIICKIINFVCSDDPNELFKLNVFRKEANSLIVQLSAELVSPYIARINTYNERNMKFTAAEFIPNLEITETKNLTFKTLKYNLFKVLVKNEEEKINNIIEYANEIKIMQQYLNNIYESIKSDSRFLISEV